MHPILLLSKGTGFAPIVAQVVHDTLLPTDRGHFFRNTSELLVTLEKIGVETGDFGLELRAVNSCFRTWIPLTLQQAKALIALD